VRHIPATLEGWDIAKDNLKGTEVYGEEIKTSEAWALKFSGKFDSYKVESLDGKYSETYKKADFKLAEEKLLTNPEMIKTNGGAAVYLLMNKE